MKKLISLILCIAMVLSLVPAGTLAASSSLSLEEELAEDLKALGVFKGVSETDFALGRAPTRTEALIMLIRVLGKEADALSKGGKHPFLDVPAWADKYVGYAYENKLTNGMSATKFGGNTEASSSMYLTFVLRALGYSDAGGADFTWDNPFTLARSCGIMLGNPDTIKFLRADVVLVSYAALEAEVKGTKQTLAQKLISAGVFTAAAYDKYYDIAAFESTGTTEVRELSADEIYEKCSPAVFYIEIYDKNGQKLGSGSGFFIDSDGTAVTNYHVIEDVYSAKIKRSDTGSVHNVLGVYDYNAARDWAIIKVDGKDFPYLEIDETPVTGGQAIYAIGSPIGLDNTISEGLVSNPNRTLDNVPFIQISAPISHGSSGGALINKLGKVVGITSAGFDEAQNLNLALPISIIKGHKKTTPHPFSALLTTDEDKPFGNIDLDVYPENERAFELLKMWIYNSYNKTMEWGPGYIEVWDSDEGQQQLIISYDEDNRRVIVSYGEYGADYEYTAAIDFDTSTSTAVQFTYNSTDYYGREVYDWGYDGQVYKGSYYDGMELVFSDYGGDYASKGDWQEYTASVCMYLLSVIESIFLDNLSGYEVDGVRALGFENCYFE